MKRIFPDLFKNIKVRSEFEFAIWGLTYHPQKMASIQVILQSLYNNSTIVNLFDVTNKEIINRIKNNKIIIKIYRLIH